MELTCQQMITLKEKELELLRAFIDVCAELKLKYYVLGGTLLGAVRHQGFIPWDDDIDVGMPRKDYEIFLREGQKCLPESFFIQSFHSDPEFPANFAKMRNSNTTFVEYSIKDRCVNHGIYIDVFPLDFYPENNQRFFDIKHQFMKLRITDAFTPDKMKFTTKTARCISRILYPRITDAIQKREVLLTSCTGSKLVANHCGAWGKREIVPEHWYGEGVTLMFEGLQVQAPSQYKQWLTQVYGDYMQLPPEHKRIPHHYVAAFDAEKSYTEYIERK